MSYKRNEWIFHWFIENYSYCWHKTGEPLSSPEFSAIGLEGTTWNIRLYPKGSEDTDAGYVSLFLRRKNDCGPKSINLNFELSVHGADGANLFRHQFENTFEKDRGYGLSKVLRVYDVLEQKRTKFLPQDTLSIRCRLWRGEGDMQPLAQIYARTRIGTQQISFLHEIEKFSTLKSNQKNTVRIGFPSVNGFALSSNLYYTDGPPGEKFFLDIVAEGRNHILSKCELSLLDESGRKKKCAEINNQLKLTGCIDKINTLSIDEFVTLNEHLLDDKLSLSCECIFSTRIEYEKIENTLLETRFVGLNQNEKHPICNSKDLVKSLFFAIFSCFLGICVAHLWR